MGQPLETRQLSVKGINGTERTVPAIHEMWRTCRTWTRYLPCMDPAELEIPGARDYWLDVAAAVDSDLQWLLQLPAHKFWSQVVHDKRLKQWLDHLLQQLPREHDEPPAHPDLNGHNRQILQALYTVFVRLCTYKESSVDFFTPAAYGGLIYESHVMDIPRILDLCVLFRGCNRDVTRRMIKNLFDCQPRYMEDLANMGFTMERAFESAGEEFQVLCMSAPSRDSVSGLTDLISFVSDVAHSVDALVEVFPSACHSLHLSELEVRLASFYQSTLIPLQEQVIKFESAAVISATQAAALTRRLNIARHRLVTAFRSFINSLCLGPLLGDQGRPAADTDHFQAIWRI